MPSGPKSGDTYLHCGHFYHNEDDPADVHFWDANDLKIDFGYIEGGKFGPPTRLIAQWIIQCEDCHSKLPRKPKPENYMILGYDIWEGNDSVIKHPVHEQN